MTWRELQTELGNDKLDKIVGGFGLEAGLDESDKTLDDDLYDCLSLRKIRQDLLDEVISIAAYYPQFARLYPILRELDNVK